MTKEDKIKMCEFLTRQISEMRKLRESIDPTYEARALAEGGDPNAARYLNGRADRYGPVDDDETYRALFLSQNL